MARDLVLADSLDLLREMALGSRSGTPGEVPPVRVEGLVAGGPTKTTAVVYIGEGSREGSSAAEGGSAPHAGVPGVREVQP